jgi:L-fuconolactonase
VKRIDAHQHFWNFDPARDSWITDDMQIIRKDFAPAELKAILDKHSFDGCITVQSDPSFDENHFQLHNAEANDFIKGIVGWSDFLSPHVEKDLEYLSQFKKMKGFRYMLQGLPQRDLMLHPQFMNGISLLGKHNFAYDLLILRDQLPYVANLVSAFPQQKFVIDHLAKPDIRSGEIKQWKKDIAVLGQFPNLYCKLSGMVTEADWKKWKREEFTSYIDTVVETFGTNRILFGSDWPVCLLAASYDEVLNIAEDYFASFSQDEQERVFGLNAIDFYNLEIPD